MLALLEHAAKFLVNTSALVKRTSADFRHELVAFERDAALAKTANAIKPTPANDLKMSATSAGLAKQLTISNQGNKLRMEISGEAGGGAGGVLERAELERILQMLQAEVAKAGWMIPPANSDIAPSTEAASKASRH